MHKNFIKIEFVNLYIEEYFIMENNIEWANFTITQKKDLFQNYIKDALEINKIEHENGLVSNLIYNKNNTFLQTLKKDKEYIKKLNIDNVMIKNGNIYQIKNIMKNKDGLYYYNAKMNQFKIPVHNYKTVKKLKNLEKKNRNK
jgi:hypothetical protein